MSDGPHVEDEEDVDRVALRIIIDAGGADIARPRSRGANRRLGRYMEHGWLRADGSVTPAGIAYANGEPK